MHALLQKYSALIAFFKQRTIEKTGGKSAQYRSSPEKPDLAEVFGTGKKSLAEATCRIDRGIGYRNADKVNEHKGHTYGDGGKTRRSA